MVSLNGPVINTVEEVGGARAPRCVVTDQVCLKERDVRRCPHASEATEQESFMKESAIKNHDGVQGFVVLRSIEFTFKN